MNKTEESGQESKARGASRVGSLGQEGEGELSLDRVREITRNLGEQLETQIHERPFVVLGAVAGASFVAGSLLGSRLGQIAVAIAGGYLVRNALNQAAGPGGVQRVVKESIEKITHPERTTG
jgi:hypothetical protein